jgi:hypothetical protein
MWGTMTVATIIADAVDFATEFAVAIGVLVAFWAGCRMINTARGFFGG